MKIKLATLIFLTLCACKVDNTPNCNDEKIKKIALEKLRENIKEEILNDGIEQEININDLRSYAYDNGLDSDEFINNEKNKFKKKHDSRITQYIIKEYIMKNTRISKIEEEIKKCTCLSEIISVSNNKKIGDLEYTAQPMEDGNDNYYIEINFK